MRIRYVLTRSSEEKAPDENPSCTSQSLIVDNEGNFGNCIVVAATDLKVLTNDVALYLWRGKEGLRLS